MSLIAADAADRAEQLIVLTERLTALIVDETGRIEARQPSPGADALAEKERLANAYRLEMARIQEEPALLSGAPAARLSALKRASAALREALGAHTVALGAVKAVSEGLMQAMAEEIALQRAAARPYASDGAHSRAPGPQPVALDRSA
jgi:hypothetical protein